MVDWVAPEVDPTGPAGRLLTRLAKNEASLLGPRLLFEQTANALVSGIRRRRRTGAQADTAFLLLRQRRSGSSTNRGRGVARPAGDHALPGRP